MSQKVLVAGTGITGIAAAKLLLSKGGEVVLYDGNEKLDPEELKKKFDEGADDHVRPRRAEKDGFVRRGAGNFKPRHPDRCTVCRDDP